MKSMRGITVLGFLFFALMVILLTILTINLAPPYMENYQAKKALNDLNEEQNITLFSKAKLRDMFIRKLDVNNIRSISPDDLTIEKVNDQHWMVLKYEARVHIFSNIDALVKFNDRILISEKQSNSN